MQATLRCCRCLGTFSLMSPFWRRRDIAATALPKATREKAHPQPGRPEDNSHPSPPQESGWRVICANQHLPAPLVHKNESAPEAAPSLRATPHICAQMQRWTPAPGSDQHPSRRRPSAAAHGGRSLVASTHRRDPPKWV